MPNYEITISVHVPDELVTLARVWDQQTTGRVIRPESDTRTAKTIECIQKLCDPPIVTTHDPKPPKAVTIEDAKAAVLAWAQANAEKGKPGSGTIKAKDALAKHFGIKLSEMAEEQAEAIHLFFTGGAN